MKTFQTVPAPLDAESMTYRTLQILLPPESQTGMCLLSAEEGLEESKKPFNSRRCGFDSPCKGDIIDGARQSSTELLTFSFHRRSHYRK